MKKLSTLLLGIVAFVCFVGVLLTLKAYDYYVYTSQELLWEIEAICEENGIHWSDTICEGDNWSDYNDARKALGFNELEYYGDVNSEVK